MREGVRLPWEDGSGRRQWSAMKASLREPLRLVGHGKKWRREQSGAQSGRSLWAPHGAKSTVEPLEHSSL